MTVIVSQQSAQTVIVDRARTARIVEQRPEVRSIDDTRTLGVVMKVVNTTNIAGIGVQGAAGPPGGTSEPRTAAEALGGHRIVRSTGADAVGYASNDNPLHGDDTQGMTLGAAAQGSLVTVQRVGSVAFNGWNWTQGAPVFLGTNGLPTQTAPSSGFVQVIGHAEDSTTLYLQIQPPMYFED